MIDTLMALWNRGYGGRGILVTTAFFLICISISLLLVTVGNSITVLFPHGNAPGNQQHIVSSADLTATSQLSSSFKPVADNTAAIVAPTPTTGSTATATANPCKTTISTANRTPQGSWSATPHGGVTPTAKRTRPTPTPVKTTPTPTPPIGI